MSEIVKWVWVAFLVFATLVNISSMNEAPTAKPPKVVAFTVLIQGLLIASIPTYWVK